MGGKKEGKKAGKKPNRDITRSTEMVTEDMDEPMIVYKAVNSQQEMSKWIFLIDKFGGNLLCVEYDRKREIFTISYTASKFQHYKMVDMAKTMAAWRLEKRQDPKFVQQAVEFYIENR